MTGHKWKLVLNVGVSLVVVASTMVFVTNTPWHVLLFSHHWLASSDELNSLPLGSQYVLFRALNSYSEMAILLRELATTLTA